MFAIGFRVPFQNSQKTFSGNLSSLTRGTILMTTAGSGRHSLTKQATLLQDAIGYCMGEFGVCLP